ncbi:MerR family transcriptional regulator [Shewanella sp.]|uniref:MerR family transcriptional regulator n=1 Tax=Shewanella sp. TaxID=50422 RepID=UPI00356686D3
MAQYSVSELAKLAGVSVRTLHHYDETGLLSPSGRSAGGYRIYGDRELIRLQQILMYRELGLKRADIKALIHNPEYRSDQQMLACLKDQYQQLGGRIAHFEKLRGMLALTIDRLENGSQESWMTDKHAATALFSDFSDKVRSEAALRKEAVAKWGEEAVVRGSRGRDALAPSQKAVLGAEGEAIAMALAALLGEPPESEKVQALMARQHRWLSANGECPRAQLPMLAAMYLADDRFRPFYDRFGEGSAALMHDGLLAYAASD